jgi:hypothetical protein
MAKVKVKLSLCLNKHHAMKTYWGSRGIVPNILNIVTRWRSVVRFTPQSLYPRDESSWYPLDRRLGGPQSRSGRSGEEKNECPSLSKFVDYKVKLKVSLCLIKLHPIKTYLEVEVRLYTFLTSALDTGKFSASCPHRFTAGKRSPGTQWIGGLVGLRTRLDAMTQRKYPLPAPAPAAYQISVVQPVAYLKLANLKANCEDLQNFSMHIFGVTMYALGLRNGLFSSLQVFRPEFYMHFSCHQCVLHTPPISSSLT